MDSEVHTNTIRTSALIIPVVVTFLLQILLGNDLVAIFFGV